MHKVCPQCHRDFSAALDVCPADGAPLRAPVDPLIGQLLADRYRVQRSIGEGGMGRVYLAEHERMGRLSAVKVMSAALAATPEAISRFNREAANASRIHQPNVAAIYDFGETADGTLYLAMEYVEGETLSSLLRREGPLAPARAAELTGQIADGLFAAHHLGIVHRDLKPDNVLVTRHLDGREWVKIVDFGIAKQTQKGDQTVTSLGSAIGTPEYMSPEQLAGENLDARTDLYSLGLVLFNMLTGALPHAALTSKQSLVQRLTARPRSLADVRPGIAWPPRLQKTLDRALAPEPDERYGSVGDFARDVRASVGGSLLAGAGPIAGVAAPRLSTVARATPLDVSGPGRAGPARRERKAGGVVLAMVFVLVAGGVAMVGQPPRALARLWGAGRPSSDPADRTRADSARADAARRAAEDSAATPVAAALPESLSPVDPALRLRIAGMRSARRADGDTVAAGAASSITQPAESDAREIMVHVGRARENTRAGQLQGAGLELQTSYQEYRIFLTEHASAPQTEMLRRELQGAMDEALAACNAEREAVAARGGRQFRCEHPAKSGILVADDAAPPAVAPTP